MRIWFLLVYGLLLSTASCKSQKKDNYDIQNFYQIDSVFDNGKIYKRIYKSKLDSSISYVLKYGIDGKLQSCLYFKNGRGNGPYSLYYSDGLICSKGMVKNGREEGEWITFNEAGMLIRKEYYKDGKEIGEWLIYDDTGKLIRKEYYKDGELIEKVKVNK